nr:MAG TPA: EB1-like C-terminal motif [Caudoviricetes sp.]DAZ76941.1 MAG TPA: EB1-like C-terminal motif [Caudoviricetes sp.]
MFYGSIIIRNVEILCSQQKLTFFLAPIDRVQKVWYI